MKAYYRMSDDSVYELKPMTREDFMAAFCTVFEDGSYAIKALTGYPSFFVPDTDLLWPLPPKGLKIIYEEG